MEEEGGKYRIIQLWTSLQPYDSWINTSQLMKFMIMRSRKVPQDSYWFRDGVGMAEAHYDEFVTKIPLAYFDSELSIEDMQEEYFKALENDDIISEEDQLKVKEMLDTSFHSWMAFNMEMLSNMDFPGNDRGNGRVTLIRTEDRAILEANGLNPGDEKCSMKSGVAESASIMSMTSVSGAEVTIQEVPYHRIAGTYLTALSPSDSFVDTSSFGTDSMKEFLFMREGIPFDYQV